MARIFLGLALFAVGLLITNLLLGLNIGDYSGVAESYLAEVRKLNELRRTPGSSEEELNAARESLRQATEQFAPVKSRVGIHMLLGLAAALTTLLVNSITITYFIGTHRWCREVAETYGLSDKLVQQSKSLKKRSFPWALGGIITIILIAALGAAADPGNFQLEGSAEGAQRIVTYHYFAAVLGVAVIAYAFLQQMKSISANYLIIAEILRLVQERQEAKKAVLP